MPKKPDTHPRGEAHGRAVLKEHEVVRLRQQPENQAFRQRLLTKASKSAVYSAQHGRTWTHLNKVVKPVKGR